MVAGSPHDHRSFAEATALKRLTVTVRHFSVAGESYLNDDGSDRQTIIASRRVDEPLIPAAEPDNPEDESAGWVL